MSSSEIDELIEAVQAAFDERPSELEDGLDVEDAAVLQLRKSCRLLTGARALLDSGFYTLVIESSFVAIERIVEFRLLEQGETTARDLPGSHPAVYREAARIGLFSERTASELANLWRDHRAKTYYQDGLASEARARKLLELAEEVHRFVVGRSTSGHECICG